MVRNSLFNDKCYLFRLTGAGADDNVEHEHVVDLELVFLDLLLEGFLVDDAGVAVQEELVDLVREHTLDRAAFEGLAALGDHVRNLRLLLGKQVTW